MGWPTDADIERERIAKAERDIHAAEARMQADAERLLVKLYGEDPDCAPYIDDPSELEALEGYIVRAGTSDRYWITQGGRALLQKSK